MIVRVGVWFKERVSCVLPPQPQGDGTRGEEAQVRDVQAGRGERPRWLLDTGSAEGTHA